MGDGPVVLYNVPGRTASNIAAATALTLARETHNIVAVKEASGDFAQIMAILRDRPPGFRVLSGDDAVTRSEEHTSELQSQSNLVCRLLLEKKKTKKTKQQSHKIQQRSTNAHLDTTLYHNSVTQT